MTIQELLQQLLSNISDEFDKSVGSFFYDAEMPVAIMAKDIYDQLEQITLRGFAKTATGEWLDFKVAEQGLTRRQATFSEGFVAITGDEGAAVPLGTKVASSNAVFSTTEAGEIIDGSAIVPIKCDTAGAVGNVPIGAINKFPTTPPNLLTVTNNEPTDGGYDTETDESLRERFFEKVSEPASSGNAYHYRQWAKEVVGVGDVHIIPTWNGAGTVKIVVISSDGSVAPPELIAEVAAHIEVVRPIGADVTVVSATPVAINVSVKIVGDSSFVAESLDKYLKSIAFSATQISYAQIGNAIIDTVGVEDYENLTVGGGIVNIPIADDEIGVLGNVTFIT